MGLVTTWLRGIGLSHCSAAFRAAGITTPSALSKLTLADYDRLGVVDVNERKKLFYLVQRIKMAVRESTAQDGDENNPNEQSDNVRVGEPTGSRSPTSGLKEPPPPQQPDLKMTKSASYSSAASQLSVNANRTPSPIDTAMNNESPKLKEAKLMRNLSFEREEIKKRSATPMTESEDEALEDVVVVPIPTKTKIQLPQKRHELLPPNPPSRDSPRKEFSFEAPSSDEDVAQPSGQTLKKQPSRGTSKIPAPSKRAVQQQRPPNSPYMSSEDEEDQEFLRRQAEEEKKRRRKERLVEQRRRQQEQAEEEERIRLEEEKFAEELEMRRQKEEEEKIRRKQRQVEQMKRKQQQAKEEARLRRLQEEEEEEEEMRRLEEEEEILRQQQKAQAQARKSRQSLSTPPRHSKPSRSRSTPPTPPDQSSNGAYAVPHQQRRNSSSPNKRPSSSPSHPPLHKIRSRSPSPSPNVPEEAVTYQGKQDAQTWQDFVDYSRR
ncbi:hypothetical protein TrVE_jg12532 [Triparma verrucosa]|uniref:SAM domain-containing protein n=1 Tax=Triparma verrucosa TaxID=1606542 RepID=A0A9W7KUB3_9STRA|nr:hypothetical protein TrVE_jg12532 [Triparma verrucosa]